MARDKTSNYQPENERRQHIKATEESKLRNDDIANKINGSVANGNSILKPRDGQQNGKNIIHFRKKNASHDPEY